jgi:hypothetical protein
VFQMAEAVWIPCGEHQHVSSKGQAAGQEATKREPSVSWCQEKGTDRC